MKIKKIEIRDYKAFYGTKKINVEGKNYLFTVKMVVAKVLFTMP